MTAARDEILVTFSLTAGCNLYYILGHEASIATVRHHPILARLQVARGAPVDCPVSRPEPQHVPRGGRVLESIIDNPSGGRARVRGRAFGAGAHGRRSVTMMACVVGTVRRNLNTEHLGASDQPQVLCACRLIHDALVAVSDDALWIPRRRTLPSVKFPSKMVARSVTSCSRWNETVYEVSAPARRRGIAPVGFLLPQQDV